MSNLLMRLSHYEQQKWLNNNNWAIFQSALVRKGATTYSYPSAANSGIEEKLSFKGNENQINHFNANPADIAKNIMVSRYGPQWEQVGSDMLGEAAGDKFGNNVVISADGKTIAISAFAKDSDSITDRGIVQVHNYRKNDDGVYGWYKLGSDIKGEALRDFSGGSRGLSLSANGKILAIGSKSNDSDNVVGSGHVRVYEYRPYRDHDNISDNESKFHYGSTSSQTKPLIITEDFTTPPFVGQSYWIQLGSDIDGAANEQIGYSVSLSSDGSILAIGAPSNLNSNVVAVGFVRVYKFDDDSDSWQKHGNDIVGTDDYDKFGNSISLSANGLFLAIGANKNDNSNGADSGYVQVFEFTDSQWTTKGNAILGEAPNDENGYSVSLSANGKIVAIGAIKNDNSNGADSGHVRVFEFLDQDWTPKGNEILGESPNDRSGNSVSLSADGMIVAIGAEFNDGNSDEGSFGHVRVYKFILSENKWEKMGFDIDGKKENENSGYSVSLSADGSVVAIGTPFYDVSNAIHDNRGIVRVYQIAKRNPWVQQGLDIEGGKTGDLFGRKPNVNYISISGNGLVVAVGSPIFNAEQVDVYEIDNGFLKKRGGSILKDVDQKGTGSLDYFGFSVSLNHDGTALAVGAIGYSALGDNYNGDVSVYRYETNDQGIYGWHQYGSNINGNGSYDLMGYSVSITDSNGSLRVAIGSPSMTVTSTVINKGYVSIYDYNANKSDANDNGPAGWDRVGSIIEDGGFGHEFGYSVSMSSDGTIIAVGTPKAGTGAVMVYQYKEHEQGDLNWHKIGSDIVGKETSDFTGYSVSLNSNAGNEGSDIIVAIGYPEWNRDSGSIRIYRYEENEEGIIDWNQLGSDINVLASRDSNNGRCCVSLSANGKIVAVGSADYDSPDIGDNCGVVQIYQFYDNSWHQKGANIEGKLSGDLAGTALSLNGDGSTVVIAAPNIVPNSLENYFNVYKFTEWSSF
ncbi:MAG: WD40 repeat domain-containing protein [Vampirovibrionia bacterium]